MFRLSLLMFCLLSGVCAKFLCSDLSHCPGCPKGMQRACFRRTCKCFGAHVPNECYSPVDCNGLCLPGSFPVCADGRCYCKL